MPLTFRRLFESVCAVGVLLLYSLFFIPPVVAEDKTSPGVKFVKPPAKYRSKTSKEWKTISDTGEELPPAGDLLVEDSGLVQVGVDSGIELNINEQSGIRYNVADDSSELFLNHGSAKLDVDKEETEGKPITIKTSQATIGIRGTIFGVSYEEEKLGEVFVEEGVVNVSAQSERRQLRQGRFASFGREGSGERSRILKSGKTQTRHKTVWNHWDYQRQLHGRRRRIDRLDRRIRRRRNQGRSVQTLVRKRDQLRSEVDSLQERYRQTQRRYKNYRERLLRRRENFLERRREKLNNYREKVIRKFRQRQKEIRDRDDNIREKQQDRLDDIRDKYDN